MLDGGAVLTAPWSLDVPKQDLQTAGPADLPDWAKGTLAVLNNLTMAERYLSYELKARFEHPDGFALRRNLDVHIH